MEVHKASANHYKNGCRHPDCRKAMAEWQREYRHGKTAPFRDKVARSGGLIEWPNDDDRNFDG